MRVAQLQQEQHYSLQSNRKLEEGEDHPDRDAQFEQMNGCVERALAADCPVISVGTKMRRLVGNYANGGQQWRVASKPGRSKGTTSQGWRCRGRIRMPSLPDIRGFSWLSWGGVREGS